MRQGYLFKLHQLFFFLFICCWGCIKSRDMPSAHEMVIEQVNTSINSIYKTHIAGNAEQFVNNEIITGIVTANDAMDNFYKSIVIQDSTAAITLKLDGFSLSALYPLGMRVVLRLNGMWMGEYGGMLQLGGGVDRSDPQFPSIIPLPASLFQKHIVTLSAEKMPEPVAVSYDQLHDSLHSRLVRLNNIQFVENDTASYLGDWVNKATNSLSLKYCNGGTVYLRTSGFAKFAKIKSPKGSGSITGIYSEFGSQRQLMIRDTSDIIFSSTRCNNNSAFNLLFEDFEQYPVQSTINIPLWQNITEKAKQQFQIQRFQQNSFASITALGSQESAITSWLIMPLLQLNNSKNEQLSFLTRDAFDNGATLEVLVSSNYDGKGQPWKAQWQLLKANIANGASTGMGVNWVKSGNISLNGLQGQVHIGFRYNGSDLGSSMMRRNTNFWVDDVKITAQ